MLSRFPVIASSLVVLLSKIKQAESYLDQHKMTKFLLNNPSIPQWSALQVFVWSSGLISTKAGMSLQQCGASPCPHCRMFTMACWKGVFGVALHHSLRVCMQGALPSRLLPGVLYQVWERLLALPHFVLSGYSVWLASSFTNVCILLLCSAKIGEVLQLNKHSFSGQKWMNMQSHILQIPFSWSFFALKRGNSNIIAHCPRQLVMLVSWINTWLLHRKSYIGLGFK